jgi:hypothetical protein
MRTLPKELQALRNEVARSIGRDAAKKLKLLLEGRHIYQHVVIDGEELVLPWKVRAQTSALGIVRDEPDFDRQNFTLGSTELSLVEVGGAGEEYSVLTLVVENVKLFCSECGASEAFMPVWFQDLTNELEKGQRHSYRTGPDVRLPAGFQLFAILLQCQRCTGKPEAVLIRRDGWRLSLHGRSPMEHVDVPKCIPKEERHLFRDAIIAGNGGKTLAGLFYLRAFIEQFARRIVGETGRRSANELMDDYGKTLSEQHRGLMPSLRDWYEKLSQPIHAAKDDENLFEEARAAIEQHFEIRRVFKMAEPQPARSENRSVRKADD